VTPDRWWLARLLLTGRRQIILAALAMVGRAGVLVLIPWPLKYVVNCVILGRHPPHWMVLLAPAVASERIALLNALAVAMLALALADAAMDYCGNRLFLAAGQRTVYALRRQVFNHLLGLPMAYHRRRRGGELMSRLAEDVGRIQDIIVVAGTGLFPHVLTLAGIIAVMLLIDWRYAGLAIAILPVLGFVSHRWTHLLRTHLRRTRATEGELWGLGQEVLAALPLVQTSGREPHEQRRFALQGLSSLRAALAATRTQAQLRPLIDVLIATGTTAVTWYGAMRALSGSLTPGDLLLFLAYLRGMVTPVRQITKAAPQLGRCAVALERIREVFEERSPVCDVPHPVVPARFIGRMEFRGVGFAYKPGVAALADITFTLAPGRRVALVGPTGAGKTTIAMLAIRMADPGSGQVLLDGEDLRRLPLRYVRRHVALMLQDSPLLHGTVWENIAYGRPGAGRADAIAAAVAAGVDDIIRALPDGYDTRVAERGGSLSGGQRQCIAIARVTLADARVVILDEPSSALDASTERRIAGALRRLGQDRALLVIAHRLATIRDADEIIVLAHGRIAQAGSHHALLRTGGIYGSLLRDHGVEALPQAAAE
jgi:ATP-binding cassette subfamily B protein/subfamily B ATP-binding cassette protein MsbA